MANLALPSSLARGPAIVVGAEGCRSFALDILKRQNIPSFESDSPYPAMAEISRKPGLYKTLILSLQNLFQEELEMIQAVRALHPGIDIWLCHTDGRPATLALALRLGADGIIADDGLHRMAPNSEIIEPVIPLKKAPSQPTPPAPNLTPVASTSATVSPANPVEPILTVEELRALLQQDPGE